jgi:hypothetical protein
MAWADFILSSQQSISKHEAEINNLAGTYERSALKHTSALIFTAMPDNIASIKGITSGSVAITGVYDSESNRWSLAAGEYVRIIADNDYFSITEGTGSILTSADETQTLTIVAGSWIKIRTQTNWDTKIELAKKSIYARLLAYIAPRAGNEIAVSMIDEIANPAVLGMASDYLTLSMVYADLLGKINNIAYEKKYTEYSKLYENALGTALPTINFGNFSYALQNQQGRIRR